MNLICGLVLTNEVYSTLEGFDGKFAKEEANSKKLSKDLKVMSLEKAQLESDKRFLQVRLDSLVAKKHVEKAQKLAGERAFATETIMAADNSTLEAMATNKHKLLAEVKEEIERVKADRFDAEA
ncbi:hypothetical protein Adt_18694 [Abeliophyllum distichum]|uniref:Uncharacterized protein n=1 Tax=Abeliophyllum distichum TaxID=126358 RepID=A0ABD1TK49_9LAMI